MASSSLGLNSSPPNHRRKYDVSLSFGGEDNSRCFTEALYTEFNKQNLQTFCNLAQSYMSKTEMQYSGTAFTDLREYYASTVWSLDKLVRILGSHGKKKTVLPIFYDVDPSDVQKQRGSFADAFAIHEETYKDDPDKVRRWKAALTYVANLAGWDSNGRKESELIKIIVAEIRRKLHPTFPSTVPSSSILAKTSTPYSSQGWNHNVFMSFRGDDTRLNFVDHLSASLEHERITGFRDDIGLEKGSSISSEIDKAIEESQISLVILSKDFASSPWCLNELVKILECAETSNLQTILEALKKHDEASTDMDETRDSFRKISRVRITVRYDGEWVGTAYVGGKAKEITVSKDITREELLRKLYEIVGKDPCKHEIIMKTTDECELSAPLQIVDDEDLASFKERRLCLDKSSKMNVIERQVSSSGTRRKMNALRVLVNYGGKWANSIYSGGKTKGIMVSDSITYEELVQRLYSIVEVDPREYMIIIRVAYASTLPTQPVELTNDDDLTFFIDESLEGSKIPLCITCQRLQMNVGKYPCQYEITRTTTDEFELPAQPVQMVDDEHSASFKERRPCLDKSSKMNVIEHQVSSSGTRRIMNILNDAVTTAGKLIKRYI